MRDHRHAVALAPGLQLLDGGGSESVTGGKHEGALLEQQAVGKLADRGGLADAVDADHKDHEWLLSTYIKRQFDRLEQLNQALAQRIEQVAGIRKLAPGHALAQVVDNFSRSADANICGDQAGFEFIKQIVIKYRVACKQAAKSLGKSTSGEALTPTLLGRTFGFHGLRCFQEAWIDGTFLGDGQIDPPLVVGHFRVRLERFDEGDWLCARKQRGHRDFLGYRMGSCACLSQQYLVGFSERRILDRRLLFPELEHCGVHHERMHGMLSLPPHSPERIRP